MYIWLHLNHLECDPAWIINSVFIILLSKACFVWFSHSFGLRFIFFPISRCCLRQCNSGFWNLIDIIMLKRNVLDFITFSFTWEGDQSVFVDYVHWHSQVIMCNPLVSTFGWPIGDSRFLCQWSSCVFLMGFYIWIHENCFFLHCYFRCGVPIRFPSVDGSGLEIVGLDRPFSGGSMCSFFVCWVVTYIMGFF